MNITNRAHKTFESRNFRDEAAKSHVEKIKEAASVLWDLYDNIAVEPGNSESGRLIAMSKTELEGSVMWAVKAISRQVP